MTVIWKFEPDYIDDKIHCAGKVVRWLHVEPRGFSGITLWAEVDTEGAATTGKVFETTARVYVRGTGHSMTGEEGAHIGTVVTQSGLVWHVFAEKGA